MGWGGLGVKERRNEGRNKYERYQPGIRLKRGKCRRGGCEGDRCHDNATGQGGKGRGSDDLVENRGTCGTQKKEGLL